MIEFSISNLNITLSSKYIHRKEGLLCPVRAKFFLERKKSSCLFWEENFCLFLILWVQKVILSKSKAFLCYPSWIIGHFLTKAKECNCRGGFRYCSGLGKERQLWFQLPFLQKLGYFVQMWKSRMQFLSSFQRL